MMTKCRQAFEMLIKIDPDLSEKDYKTFRLGWETAELALFNQRVNYMNNLDPLKPNPLLGWEIT